MPRGHTTPDHIQQLILDTVREFPRASDRDIADRIFLKFKYRIDKSTVGKYKRKFIADGFVGDVATPNDHELGDPHVNAAAVLRSSAHQQELSNLISQVRTIVADYPSTKFNPSDRYQERPPRIPLDEVEPLHWSGLQEHLKGDQVWDYLKPWQVAGARFADDMNSVLDVAASLGEEAFEVPFNTELGKPRLTANLLLGVRSAMLIDLGERPSYEVKFTWSDQHELLFGGRAWVASHLPYGFEEAKQRFWQTVDMTKKSVDYQRMSRTLTTLNVHKGMLRDRLAFLDLRVELGGSCLLCK